MREVELSVLDLRYESYRMRNPGLERRILTSIMERGIDEPLEGVDAKEVCILLNGFKRYRSARRLGMGIVPYISLGEDEAVGIMGLLRASNNKALSILEQSRFIDDLNNIYKMSLAQIAQDLSRSKSWVSMRLGLIEEMSEPVREKLFQGAFPVYSYMYTMRPFMRMNELKKKEAEEFIVAVSGKGLSVRDIERLARGYFYGSEKLREEIRGGHIALPLKWMKEVSSNSEGCSDRERVFLKDLEIVQKYMQRAIGKSYDRRLQTPSFYAQANLLTEGILSREGAFQEAIRSLHDRSRQA